VFPSLCVRLCMYIYACISVYFSIYFSVSLRIYLCISLCCAVGIATGYGLDDREVGLRVPVGARIFTSPCCPDRLWGPPSFLSSWYRGLPPGVKRPGSETDHSPPTSSEIKKMWLYTSTPIYVFMAQCLFS
jgi:hypothetical protein